ncbi:alpha/beta fold hydrolase [Croceicoccus bisphenolivorans]|uniref:alpha/beta fold hydrolase n=1 Tax=Croceicoccus bisphenolivorans TaxID=1783232 RepID=UPI000A859F96|nr:alpha/beta hydrolase [Croceicoccus bisphenolivorans]
MEPGSNFKRATVASFGYEVPYAEAGSGDAIVFLPGSAGLEMSTAKDELARRFRVIELDPPGWGTTPQLTAEMKQRQLATVLADAIAELGVEQFHLVGTSMGGNNAFWLAGQFPERVKSLTLEGPMLFCRPEDLVNPDDSFIQALRAGAPAPDVSGYPAPPPHPRKPWSTADFFREQMRRRIKMFAKTDYPGTPGALEKLAERWTIPTKLLLGTEDEILNPCYADRFKQVVPSAEVTIIEGATHDIQNTAPEAFIAAFDGI